MPLCSSARVYVDCSTGSAAAGSATSAGDAAASH